MCYKDGYSNGYADFLLFRAMITVALHSTLDGYSEGYRAGFWDAQHNK